MKWYECENTKEKIKLHTLTELLQKYDDHKDKISLIWNEKLLFINTYVNGENSQNLSPYI